MIEKLNHLSWSQLSLFKKDRNLYRKIYVDKTVNRNDIPKTPGQRLGSLVDCILFTPERFGDLYEVGEEPSASPMMQIFVETMARLRKEIQKDKEVLPFHYSDEELYTVAYRKSGYKEEIKKVVEKFKTKKHQDYYNYLMSDGRKTYVSEDEHQQSRNMVSSLLKNDFTKDCFKDAIFQKEILFTSISLGNVPILCIIDAIKKDYNTSTITIEDLKITNKSIDVFEESIEEYGYHKQLALYKKAVLFLIQNDPEWKKYEHWKIKCEIIPVEGQGNHRCLRYQLADDTLFEASLEVNKDLDELLWHWNLGMWDYSKKAYKQEGVLIY